MVWRRPDAFYKAGSKYEKAYHKTKSKDFQALAAIKAGQVNQNVNRLKEAYNWLRKAERANPQMPEIYLKVAQACGDERRYRYGEGILS